MFFQAQPWVPQFTKHGSGGFSDAVTDRQFKMEISTIITIAAQPPYPDWAFPNRQAARPPRATAVTLPHVHRSLDDTVIATVEVTLGGLVARGGED